MAKSKYMPKYKKMVKDYFFKFIDLRDDPDKDNRTARQGMIPIDMTGDKPIVSVKPCSGYPTLTKFACKIGVTTRTLRNWRAEFSDFDEICELCEDMFDDIMDERALVGAVDGRVAMKIRELKANARAAQDGSSDVKIILDLKDDREGERIQIRRWEGEVNENADD